MAFGDGVGVLFLLSFVGVVFDPPPPFVGVVKVALLLLLLLLMSFFFFAPLKDPVSEVFDFPDFVDASSSSLLFFFFFFSLNFSSVFFIAVLSASVASESNSSCEPPSLLLFFPCGEVNKYVAVDPMTLAAMPNIPLLSRLFVLLSSLSSFASSALKSFSLGNGRGGGCFTGVGDSSGATTLTLAEEEEEEEEALLLLLLLLSFVFVASLARFASRLSLVVFVGTRPPF